MKTSKLIFAVSALLLGAAAGSAQARYLCDAPPSPIDTRACQAAQQGPAELRRFIQRMQGVQSLLFSDYVNRATELAWEAQKQRRPIQVAGGLLAQNTAQTPR